MTPTGKRPGYLPFLLTLGAFVALGGVLVQTFLGLTSAPEGELLTQVKAGERDGLTLSLPVGGTLQSNQVRYARITVHAEPGAKRAHAVATLDFSGTLDKRTKVSALGFARIPFERKDGDWQPLAGLAPQLVAIVDTLERRRRALEAADAEALRALAGEGGDADVRVKEALDGLLNLRERRYQVLAWYVRSEREDVEVAEEYRLEGTLPDRPIDERGKTALRLQPTPGGGYSFSGKLR